jgi:hypothetical protein
MFTTVFRADKRLVFWRIQEFEGSRQMQSEATKIRRPPFLENDSVEAQIIADSQEDDTIIRHSHSVANTYRQEQGLISLTMSAIYGLIL